MKLIRVCSLMLAAAVAAGVASCDNSDKSSTNSKTDDGVEITTESFNFDLMSAKKLYKVTSGDDSLTYYLQLEANVQYPVKVGDYNLKNLQDTLGYFIDNKIYTSITESMSAFVTDPQAYELGTKYEPIDSMPEDVDQTMVFYSNVDITIQEMTSEMLTFNCTNETFLGGAHPMYGNVPFSYLLSSDEFVTNKWLFLPGTEEAVTAEIRQAIMQDLEMTDQQLDRAMLISYLPIPESVYLSDGMIVFHYNPYVILPYSYGTIDAKVSPYLLRDQLTPAAKALLIEE